MRTPLAVLLVAAIVCRSGLLVADDMPVPPTLQAELLSKAAAYDRNLAERSQGRVLVLVVTRAGSTESERNGAQIETAIRALPTMAGHPHSVERLHFTTPSDLVAKCRTRRASIVYVAVGLGAEVSSLAAALKGVDVLSASGVPAYTTSGVVLAFDLVSSYPKLLINLRQARVQNVAFDSALLRLARVVDR